MGRFIFLSKVAKCKGGGGGGGGRGGKEGGFFFFFFIPLKCQRLMF